MLTDVYFYIGLVIGFFLAAPIVILILGLCRAAAYRDSNIPEIPFRSR